jgi:hypothetical protein
VLGEAPKPEPAAGEALVSIELTGICGSDVSGFLGHSPRRWCLATNLWGAAEMEGEWLRIRWSVAATVLRA